MKRKLKRLGLIVLGLAIVGLIGLGISGIVFTNQLNAEIAAIKAKGEPVTPAELKGQPIPPSENAAVVYEQAFNALDDPAVEPQKRLIANFDPKTADAAKWREVEQALPRLHKTLGLTRQAASMPQCRFEIDWSNEQSILFPPYLAKMRSLARLTSIHARVSAGNGDMAAAVDEVDALFRMGNSMEDQPLMIHQLVRVAIISIGVKALEGMLGLGDITEAQAGRLFDAAGNIDVARGFRQGWLGERVFVIHWYSPERFAQMATSGGTGPVSRQVAGGTASVYSNTVMKGDLGVYMGIMARQVEGVNMSYAQAKNSGIFDEPVTPFYAVLSKSGIASVIGPHRYATEEKLARTRVFLALQAYKARYRGYPASMRELKSKLGWKLPVDPFSGKDFIYKRQAKGFILYSVGPDMKDDGGRPIVNDSIDLDSKGDIVLKREK